MCGTNQQHLGKARLLLFAVAFLLGCVPTAQALRPSGAVLSRVSVNGQPAQVYGDLTYACTNSMLKDGTNQFAIQGTLYDSPAIRNLSLSLPQSVGLLCDRNGNLTNDGTRVFFYDSGDQLTNITIPGTSKSDFVYDGLGRRRVIREYKWATNTWSLKSETRYVFDGMLPVQEQNTNGGVLVTYTRGLDFSGSRSGAGGIGGLLARTDPKGVGYYHSDGAGNITGLFSPHDELLSRYLYGPFGRVVGKWGPMADLNSMQFSSMPYHANSGVVGFQGRPYDPILQRWLSPDPSGEAGGINLYGFVRNNPLNFIDPNGLAPQLTGLTYDPATGVFDSRYEDQQFGQDYGIGKHGPLNGSGQFVLSVGAGMVPGVGEAMDASVLADPNSRWWEMGLAGLSLGLNFMADGLLPNAGPFLRGTKTACKDASEIPKPKLITNGKHHPNSRSPQPKHYKELYNKSVLDRNGSRYAIDADGTIHRFSPESNGTSHWNGSTATERGLHPDQMPSSETLSQLK